MTAITTTATYAADDMNNNDINNNVSNNDITRCIDNDGETTPPPPPDPDTPASASESRYKHMDTTTNLIDATTRTPVFDRPRFYDSEEEGRSLVFVESMSSLLQLSPASIHNNNNNIIKIDSSSSNIDNNVSTQQDALLSAHSFILSSSVSEDDEGNNSVVRVLRPPPYGASTEKNEDLLGNISSTSNSININDSSQVLLPYQHRKNLDARKEEETLQQQQQQQLQFQRQQHQQQQHQSGGAMVNVVMDHSITSTAGPSNVVLGDDRAADGGVSHDIGQSWNLDPMISMMGDGNKRRPPFPPKSFGAPSSPQQKQSMQQQPSSLASKFMVAPIPPFKGSQTSASAGKNNERRQQHPSSSDDSADDDANANEHDTSDSGHGQWDRIRKVKSANASPTFPKKRKKKEREAHHGSGLSPNATQHHAQQFHSNNMNDNNRPPRAPPHPQYHHPPQQHQQQLSSQQSGNFQHHYLNHYQHQDVIDPNPPPPPPPPPNTSPPSQQPFSPRGNNSGGFHIRINSQGSISSLGSNAGVDDAGDGNYYSPGGGVTTTTTSHRTNTGRQPQRHNNKQPMPPQSNAREYWYYVQQQQQQQLQQQQQQQQQQQHHQHQHQHQHQPQLYAHNPPPRGGLPQQQMQQQQHHALNYNVNYNAVLGQEVAQFLHGEHVAKAAEWNQRQHQNSSSRTQQQFDPYYGPPPYGWNPHQPPPHAHASQQRQWSPQRQHHQQQHQYGWYDNNNEDRRRHPTESYGHFIPEPQAPSSQEYSQPRQMQQHWNQYGAVPSTSPHKPYQLPLNDRDADMLGEKRSLLQPSSAGVLSGGGGGGDARRGMTPQRNHEEHLHNTFPNAPTKRADSINQKKKKTKKKGERRRYQEKRRQFYSSDSSEEDMSDNRRDWSSSSRSRRAKSKKNERSSSSQGQRRKRHSHHTGKVTPTQNDESLSETHSESFISNSMADRSRARDGVGVIHQLYISAKLLVCNLPLSFAAISFSIVLLGIVWLKWTQEYVPSCKEVNFHTSQCNFPEFPGCYFCDEYNPWYRFAVKFHNVCSWVAGTSVLLYFAKAICCWRVFIDELSSPTTASPSGLIFMTMALSFVGKFGSIGGLLVFVASFLHLILVVWFIYMSLAYQTMPDPSWFANTVGIGLCAVKVWFYSPLSGHFLIAITLMLTFVYYPISLIRVALNEKMSATICWMNMMGPSVSLYSLAIIMEPTFQQERPDISHFQMVQRSIYLPSMTCLFGLCIIGMISSVHGLVVRWRQLSRETFSPAHAAYSFPLLMHAMAVQSYRSSLDFFSPPEAGNPALAQALHIYWLFTVVVGTIAALTCIIMYLVFLPSWVDVDTRDELEPPPPNETSVCNSVTYGESLIQTYTSPTILQANETGLLIVVHDYQNDWWDLVRTRRIPAYGFEPRMRKRTFIRERNGLKLFMGWQDVILEGDEGGDDVCFDDEEKISSVP